MRLEQVKFRARRRDAQTRQPHCFAAILDQRVQSLLGRRTHVRERRSL